MDEFPGNSHTSRIEENKEPEKSETTSEPKKIRQVATGKVSQRPKTLGARFKEMFFNEGASFGEHLVENVVVPMVKDMMLSIVVQVGDGFKQGVEGFLFGPDAQGRRTRSTSYTTGRPTVQYNRFSSSTVRRDISSPIRSRNDVIRRSNRIRDVVVETRDEGEDVIEELNAMIDSIGHCTVGDFYAAVGERTHSTDEEWGWTDLRDARVERIDHTEFLIRMPRPRPIQAT
jgi:hypothetical protein